jgi:hypothetical protein
VRNNFFAGSHIEHRNSYANVKVTNRHTAKRSGLYNSLLLHDDALQVIRLELLRRDHHPSLTDSTSTQPPKSSSERFLEAVKRSHARRDAIARSMQSAPKSNSVKPSSIPVTTEGEGEYLTQIGLGTPKKTLTLILDTGSDLVWTQCLACQACYQQIDPIFNPAKSSTYKPVRCGLNLCQVNESPPNTT